MGVSMVIQSTACLERLAVMREGGAILAGILRELRGMVVPGVTTLALDERAAELFRAHGVAPAFLGYHGFPKNICTSLNAEVVHGIPAADRILAAGDILSIDIGLKHRGCFADMAVTLPVGPVSRKAADIIDAGRQTLQRSVDILHPGMPLRELAAGIQSYAEGRGYNVLRKYVGHTIGRRMHEEPQIPNFVTDAYPPADLRLEPGMTIAIEPMLTEGSFEVETAADGWTVLTRDRRLSVHFEYTVAILDDGVEVLTCF